MFFCPDPQFFTFSQIYFYTCILLNNALLLSSQHFSWYHFYVGYDQKCVFWEKYFFCPDPQFFTFKKIYSYICILLNNSLLMSSQTLSELNFYVSYVKNCVLGIIVFLGLDPQFLRISKICCYICNLHSNILLKSPQPRSEHQFLVSYGQNCVLGGKCFFFSDPQFFTFSKIYFDICILLNNTLLMSSQYLLGHHFYVSYDQKCVFGEK